MYLPFFNESKPIPTDALQTIQHPLVAIFLVLYTLVFVRLSADWAFEYFHKVHVDFSKLCPNGFYHFHTDIFMWNTITAMFLSQAFLLSNCGVLSPLHPIHFLLYTILTFTTTASYISSRQFEPIQWKRDYSLNCKHFLVFVMVLVMLWAEWILWMFGGNPEHPIIGKVFFHLSLLTFYLAYLVSNRYSNATQFLVLFEGKIVKKLDRFGEFYDFSDGNKNINGIQELKVPKWIDYGVDIVDQIVRVSKYVVK